MIVPVSILPTEVWGGDFLLEEFHRTYFMPSLEGIALHAEVLHHINLVPAFPAEPKAFLASRGHYKCRLAYLATPSDPMNYFHILDPASDAPLHSLPCMIRLSKKDNASKEDIVIFQTVVGYK